MVLVTKKPIEGCGSWARVVTAAVLNAMADTAATVMYL
jgi:hypothetical protein